MIIFVFVTLIAVFAETYKTFFAPTTEFFELTQKNETADKEGKEKYNTDEKDKFYALPIITIAGFKMLGNYYIQHTQLLPEHYTSVPELPPDLL